ncbi:sensor histidine kinase [Desulfococcus multivorans]|uniref:histidine kinase n=1 Tax=Desulfococcus multivorans DSM 2059 TaxID=1121405 RepID=S7TGL9_DESML|nr:PAS domain-containing sensor histidine kinase [Desulfococcus multivorans]AOY59928.1 two component system sensor histidine kinase [Desulfococcus multivorans]AQV02081.1 two-component sensor histidine kinase [Desulfococcus multivorans]EPR35926.1 integral membrane sensor signal transduction histidine kinase [Desulfococcus multivorans DSM 2059]SJZ35240.1 two-component system, NtrC family, sensor kinase [Desulfococcus multivorans DSM 2059]
MKFPKRHRRSESGYYQSLTRWMALIIIFVSITPVILVSGFILNAFRNSYQAKIYDHLGELVLKKTQNIDSFLWEKLSDIRYVAASTPFGELTREAVIQEKLRHLRREFDTVFEDLGVVNHEGVQLAYSGPFELEYADYSEAEWFKSAIQTRYYISDVFSGLRGKPHFIVAVRNMHDGKPWILRATLDFLSFNTLVERLRIGQTGFAIILNKYGEYQTKPFFENIEINNKNLYQFMKQADPTPKGIHIVERAGSDGRRKIYVGSFLKDDDWLLVYQQDKDDAFADLRHTQDIAVIIIVVSTLAVIAVAVMLSMKMIHRISVSDKEKEIMNQQVIETGKLASIGELASGIAHEINNPVAIMVEEAGWIEDLLMEEDLHQCKNLEEFQRAVGQIRLQGKRCKEITHKLLSFARKTDSWVQDVQINDLVEEVVNLSSQKAKYTNVDIVTRLDPNLPAIRASYTEGQQVLLNLINNALYALESKNDRGRIEINTKLADDHIVIDVIDNGSGIPAAVIPRIFDPFFTSKPVGKGTGLGLSICYGIIKKLGGEITVDSVLGEGTHFQIRIPSENPGTPLSGDT